MNDTDTLEWPATADRPRPVDPALIAEQLGQASTKARETSEAIEQTSTPPPEGAAPASGPINFDVPVRDGQRSWLASRQARYVALSDAVPLVKLAINNPDAWEVYRKDQGVKGRTIEAQCFAAIIAIDPEADEISSTRAAIYAGCIGFFAFCCPDMGAQQAIDAMKAIGGMERAAEEYRRRFPPKFTTKGGRKSRATGRRPGRKPGLAKPKGKAKIAEAVLWGVDRNGRVHSDRLPNTTRFALTFSRGKNGEHFKIGPFTNREAATRIYEAINKRPIDEVDAYLGREGIGVLPSVEKPGEPRFPAELPDEGKPTFIEVPPEAREQPEAQPVDTLSGTADKAGSTEENSEVSPDSGSTGGREHWLAECHDSFEGFIASKPDVADLILATQYLRKLANAPVKPHAA